MNKIVVFFPLRVTPLIHRPETFDPKPIAMNNQNALRSGNPDHLKVIHKASATLPEITSGQHVVIQTDIHFKVTGWNMMAEKLYGRTGGMGKNLLDLLDIEFIGSSANEFRTALKEGGYWNGEIFYRRFDGKMYFIQTTATRIIDEHENPIAMMVVGHVVNDIKKKEERLEAAEKKFEALLNSLPDGVMMIGKDGRVLACNKRGTEILGVTEDYLLGKFVASTAWNSIREDGTEFPLTHFPAIVSLQTGFPQRNVIMGILQPTGIRKWLSINSEALIRPGDFEPHSAVVSFSDITGFIATEQELMKSNERFYHVSRVTSDAIWDVDLSTNEIYRSEAFSKLSGYTPEQIGSNLNWWFDKIHPEDRDRVRQKLDEQLRLKNDRWEDEYRFEYADGSYKILNDSGMILYKEGKPVRILGAIRDITEEKFLKKQLQEAQDKKHLEITAAVIEAQEQEKKRISGELHDNVNQILMSAKLYMETALKNPDGAESLLQKTIEYQMLAMQEIRKLSRSLSTPGVINTGLQESLSEIAATLEKLQSIKTEIQLDPLLERLLQDAEKLTVYRIIQEQTNNIIKHAKATEIRIEIKKHAEYLSLIITDNGRGFDPSQGCIQKGIGMINMNTRVAAHNGSFSVQSSPGNGCRLEIMFPLAHYSTLQP